jgi:tRNA (guanosine-2'-O-)-methyltransferase
MGVLGRSLLSSFPPCDLHSLALASGVIAASAGCGPRSPAREAGPQVAVSHVAPPRGTVLEQACTPTGPELCFNAIDDNCNGVIDEGCGAQTGLLQFIIAWGSSPADVNLVVATPGGERVPDGRNRSTPSGFHLDRDCPSDDGCRGQNTENVYFDGTDVPRGHYVVEVTLDALNGAETPVNVRLGARLGSRSVGFPLELSPGDSARERLEFDVP